MCCFGWNSCGEVIKKDIGHTFPILYTRPVFSISFFHFCHVFFSTLCLLVIFSSKDSLSHKYFTSVFVIFLTGWIHISVKITQQQAKSMYVYTKNFGKHFNADPSTTYMWKVNSLKITGNKYRIWNDILNSCLWDIVYYVRLAGLFRCKLTYKCIVMFPVFPMSSVFNNMTSGKWAIKKYIV